MNKIIEILSGNKTNSNEAKALDKLNLLSIEYDDSAVTINNSCIMLSTIIAKLLADNENTITSANWLAMLAGGFTNQNKMKSNTIKTIKSAVPLITQKETVTMSASDFKAHKIGLYSQFCDELHALTMRYGIPQLHYYPDIIFDELDKTEYEQRLADEKPSKAVIDEIDNLLIGYDSLTKNNSSYILSVNENEKMSDVKQATEALKKVFTEVSRIDYIITFKELN